MEDALRQLSRGGRRRRGLTGMPLYEFQCVKCGRKVEVIQSFSDSPPAKCLHCGGTLAKLLSSPAFQFKGSGFYATDYGKSGWKPVESPTENEGGGGTPSEAGAETKADSAGDSSKDKKDSKDSSNERSGSAPRVAKASAAGDTSTEPSSRSKKSTRRK